MVLRTESPSSTNRAELSQDASPEILDIRGKRKLAAARMQLILPPQYRRGLAGTAKSEEIVLTDESTDRPKAKLWLARSSKSLTDHVWIEQQLVNGKGRNVRGGLTIPVRTWGEDITYDWGRGPEQFEAELPPEAQIIKIENVLKILDLLEIAQGMEPDHSNEVLSVAA